MKKFESLHNHSHRSNLSGYHECICTDEHFSKKIKELGGIAYCPTEHGHLLGWHKAYEAAKKHGLKYIMAVEAYVTATLDEKIKDNYHVVLIAKNQDGFHELNRLMSKSSLRDNHYYYNARITLDELFATSDNIIMLSACLGGILAKPYRENPDGNVYKKTLDFFIKNKDRCYLEIQPHASKDQVEWNLKIFELSQEYGLKVVATLDAHASSEERDETRKVLKKSKGLQYDDEDEYKLYLRSYDEVLKDFMHQEATASFKNISKGGQAKQITGLLTEEWYRSAMEMSNIIADMCEEIYIDTSIKYPHMSANPDEAERKVKRLIKQGIKNKNLNNLSEDEKKQYNDRLKHELNTFKALDCWDYFLLEDEVKEYARKRGIAFGTRGSASASLACFLMDITRINPIKSELPFERFMDVSRPGAPDID